MKRRTSVKETIMVLVCSTMAGFPLPAETIDLSVPVSVDYRVVLPAD